MFTFTAGYPIMISQRRDLNQDSNGDFFNPVISSDGRFVTFESTASNLAANDADTVLDVFRVISCRDDDPHPRR